METLEERVNPATFDWVGTGSDSLWSTPGNWAGGAVPTNGSDIRFDSGVPVNSLNNVNNIPSLVVNSITFQGDGYVINGNQLTVNNNITMNASVGDTINLPIKLGGNAGNNVLFNVLNSGATLNVNGTVSGTGINMTFPDQGQVVFGPLSNNVNFQGQVFITAGDVQILNSNALGTGAPGTGDLITVQPGAQLQIGAVNNPVNVPLVLSGTGLLNDGALRANAGAIANPNTATPANPLIYAGNISLAGNTAIGAITGAALQISGNISDQGSGFSLFKEGDGEILLSGNNTYRKQTIIDDGVLSINNGNALGVQSAAASAGVIVNYNIGSNIGGTLALDAGQNGGPGFTVPQKQLTLFGLGFNDTVRNFQYGALFNWNGNNTWGGSVLLSPTSGADPANIQVFLVTPGANPATAPIGNTLTITGVVSDVTPVPAGGPFGLIKTGLGELILTNTNTYADITTIRQGVIDIQASQGLGTNTTVVTNNAALWYQSPGPNFPSLTVSNALTLVGTGVLTPAGFATPLPLGALVNIAGVNTQVGNINLAGNPGSSIGVMPDDLANATFNSQLTVTGTIRGSELFKDDNGELVLPNANIYTGGTDIRGGWITAENTNAAGSSLGGLFLNEGPTSQPVVTVRNGAALVLKQNPSTQKNLTLVNPLVLFGLGLTSANTKRFPELTGVGQAGNGALLNLAGQNVVSGTITLNGSQSNGGVGIGVEIETNYPPTNPAPASQLTVTGSLTEPFAPADISSGLVKLGSQLLILQGPGSYTGNNDFRAGVVLIQSSTALGHAPVDLPAAPASTATKIENGAALELGMTVPSLSGGVATGLQVFDEDITLIGQGNNTLPGGGNIAPLTNIAGDNLWWGNVNLQADPANASEMPTNIDVQPNTRLSLFGNINDAIGSTKPSDLTMMDNGILVLGGQASTYSGKTFINKGVVNVVASGGLGASTGGAVTVASGAQLQLSGTISVNKALIVQGTGVSTPPTVGDTWFPQGPAPVTNGLIVGSGQDEGGQVTDVATDPFDPLVWYITTGGGGAWKTIDGGLTWHSLLTDSTVTDSTGNPIPVFASSIAVSPTNSNWVYVGLGNPTGSIDTVTGSPPPFPNPFHYGLNPGDAYAGRGVLISSDAGNTWSLTQGNPGLQELDFHSIDQIVVDPNTRDPLSFRKIYVTVNSVVKNGTTGNNGVWFFDPTVANGPQWTNLSQQVSAARSSNNGGPGTPGPDDVTTEQFFADDRYSSLRVVEDPFQAGNNLIFFAIGSDSSLHASASTTPGAGPVGNFSGNGAFISVDSGASWNMYGFPTGNTSTLDDQVAGTGLWEPHSGNIQLATSSFAYASARNGPGGGFIHPSYNLFAAVAYPNDRISNPAADDTLREISVLTLTFNFVIGAWTVPPGGWAGLPLPGNNYLGSEAFYADSIAVDPSAAAADTVFVAGRGNTRSPGNAGIYEINNALQAGATWFDITVGTNGKAPHIDSHSLEFTANGTLLNATDGGLWELSNPSTATPQWTDVTGNMQTGQATSAVLVSNGGNPNFTTNPYLGYIGLSADDGIAQYSGGLTAAQQDTSLPPGNAGQIAVNPKNNQTVYYVDYFSNNDAQQVFPPGASGTPIETANGSFMGPSVLRQSLNGGQNWATIYTNPGFPNEPNGEEFPFVLDQIDPQRLVVGGLQGLFQSLNGGQTFTRLVGSPLNNTVIALAQQPDFALNPGANPYDRNTIYTIAYTVNPNTLAQTYGVYVTTNGGQSWSGPRTPNPNPGGVYSDIVVDPRASDTVYLTRSNFTENASSGRIFVSKDFGVNWADITGNLPFNLAVWKIVVDPRNSVLYVGTDAGVYFSTDGGGTWNPFGTGLAKVQVRDLFLNQTLNTLTAATYGAGVYTLFLNDPNATPNSGVVVAVSGTPTWLGPVTMIGNTSLGAEGTQTFQSPNAIGTATAQLTFQGPIGDNGSNPKLTKVGQGTVVLDAANTYKGVTEVQTGVLDIQNPQALSGSMTVVDATPVGGQAAALWLESSVTNGEPLTLNNDGIPISGQSSGALFSRSQPNTYNGPITLGTQQVTIGAAASSPLTITGEISDAGSGSPSNIVKVFPGQLTLDPLANSGNNNYFGTTTVDQGILELLTSGALGVANPNSGTSVLNGAQLQLAGGINIVGMPLSLSGQGIANQNTGALNNVSGNNAWTGPITFSSLPAATLPPPIISIFVTNLGDELTLNGSIAGDTAFPNVQFGLDKIGPGTLSLQQGDSYTGPTTVDAGILNLENASAISGSSILVSSGASLGLTTLPSIGPGISFNPTNVPLTINGTGSTQFLSSFFNGTQQISATSASGLGALFNGAGNNSWQGPVTLGNNSASLTDAIDAITGSTLTMNTALADFAANAPATLTVGVGSTDGGTVVFPGANNYVGQTLINNGVLLIENASSLGGGAGTIVNSTPTQSGTLQLGNGITVSNEALTLNGPGFTGLGSLDSLAIGAAILNTWDKAITLGSNASFGAEGGANLVLDKPIGDNGNHFNVNKVGAGTVLYQGTTSNTYSGTTTVSNGVLLLNKTGGASPLVTNPSNPAQVTLAIGGSSTAATARWGQNLQIPAGAVVDVNNNGTLDLNDQTDTIDTLNVTDGFARTGANGTGNLTVSTALNMVGGLISVDKTGSVLSLSGNAAVTATSDSNASALSGTATINNAPAGGGGVFALGGSNRVFNVTAGTKSVDLRIVAPLTGQGLNKTGTGLLELDGNSSLSGAAIASAGTLQVDAPSGVTVGTVSLNGGTLTGNGHVTNITPGVTQSTVQPGDLNVTGVLTADNTSLNNTTFNVILNSTAPGTGYSQLNVPAGGTINLNGSTLGGVVGPNVHIGDSFTIITGSGTVTGQFNNGAAFAFIGGKKFTISYPDTHTVVLTRTKISTSVTITPLPGNPSVFGQPVTFEATVTPEPGAGAVPNTDTVTFNLDGQATTIFLKPVAGTANAIADLATGGGGAFPLLSVGAHTVSVAYSGDADYLPSNFGPVTQTVNKANTFPALTSTTGSPTVFGQSVVITATISAIAPGAGNPTGTVQFTLDGNPIGSPQTLQLSGTANTTQASITLTNLSVNLHRIQVSYSGDGNFNASQTSNGIVQEVDRANTNVVVSGFPNPGRLGQQVTFTANVAAAAPGAGNPTGVVVFSDNGSPLGQGNVDPTTGAATFSTTVLSVGSHTITAAYQGDSNFNPGQQNFTQAINPGTTATTLISSLNPSAVGQTVTFTATVAPVLTTSAIPTGTVTFFADGVALTPSVPVNGNGQATFSISTLGIGSHQITAVYNGDSNFSTSSSNAVTQNVSTALATTTITSSGSPSNYGQLVTYTATVTPQGAVGATPTGSITFSFDGTAQATVNLNAGGQATFSSTALGGGNHTVTATYSGDANFGTSTGNVSQTVNPAGTTTALSASANNIVFGQTITFTATVSASGTFPAAPTGNVVFMVDGLAMSPVPINGSGQAIFSTSTLSQGTHQVTATYNGDSNYNSSTSPALAQTINQSGSSTTLATSQATAVYGQDVITATVSPVAPGAGTPTGSVVFTINNGSTTTTVSGNLVNGVATLSPTLGVGSYTVSAAYGGDGNFAASNSGTITQKVTQAGSNLQVSSSAATTVFGQPVTFTATVTPAAPAGGVATGKVIFTIDGVAQPAVSLDNTGKATITATTLQAGSPHQISASYGGDNNFANSTSNTISQSVKQASTTTTLATTQPSAVYGQAAITAKVAPVAPGGGTPTGTVTFTINNGSSTSTATATLSGGVATLGMLLPVGSYTITASYGGDSNFLTSSTGSALSQTVTQAKSAIALTSSQSPSGVGQPVTFTATITPVAPAGGVATGNVVFTIDGVSQSPVPIDSTGKATLTTSSLPQGTHAIGASYAGDTNFQGSSAPSLTQVVKPASTTALSTSANPALAGQNITFTASVTGNVGPATGTVTFKVDGQNQPAVSLSGGTATLSLNNLTVGSHTVIASYSGDTNYAPSTSTSITEVVNQANVTIALSSTGASVFGQSITLTATMTPAGQAGGTPTGQVIFSIDGQAQPAIAVSGGVAALTTNGLTVGSHTITAAYSGDTNFSAGSSAPLTQLVGKDNVNPTVTSSANPAVSGQTVTLSANVAAAPPGAGTPTGTVLFSVDGVAQPSVPLDASGNATLSLINLSTGTHSVTVAYNGDGNFNTGTSASFTQTVSADSTTTTLVSAGNTIFGQGATFTATVVPAAPGGGTPTGSVTFLVDGLAAATVNLNGNGTATFTTATLTATSHAITAVYNGDSNFAGSSGAAAQSVSHATPNVALVSSAGSAAAGEGVTFTAVVSSGGAPAIPTGTVSFFADGVMIGTVSVDANGNAVFTTTSLPPGTRSVSAVYSGDGNFASTTSAVLTQAVTSVTLNAPASTTVPVGKPFNLQIRFLLPNGQLATTFTGEVTIRLHSGPGTLGGTLTVRAVGGVATFNLTLSKIGKYTLDVTSVATGGATITVNATASHLTVAVPKTVAAFTPFNLTVTATDLKKTIDSLFKGTVKITIAKGPKNGQLLGKSTGKIIKGKLTLHGLEFNKSGTYTLNISAGLISTKVIMKVGGNGRRLA